MAHARLSASAAHRWMSCPGSVSLAAVTPNKSSEAAAQGTYAHHIAAACLLGNSAPAEWLGNRTIIDGFEIECDQEMVDGVTLYLEAVRGDQQPGDFLLIEVNVTEELRTLDRDMGGTADAVRFRPADGSLRTFDLKYGAGVFVEVEDNRQLAIYLLGAARRVMAAGMAVKSMTATVVQPRAGGNPVRDWKLHASEVMEYTAAVRDAAEATRDPLAPLVPSASACKWCPVLHACPAAEKQHHALVAASMADLTMTPATLAAALDSIPVVEGRIKAIREYAYAEALAGRCPPGYKLVAKRPTRKWASTAEVEAVATPDWYESPALRSPAQIEKLLGKRRFDEEVAKHVISVSSGQTLVPAADKRKEMTHAAEVGDFAVIDGTAERVS